MCRILLLLIATLTVTCTKGQTILGQSSQERYENTVDSIRYYINKDRSKARAFATLAYAQAESLGVDSLIIQSQLNIATTNYYIGSSQNLQIADSILKIVNIQKLQNYTDLLYKYYNLRGACFQSMGDQLKARDAYLKGNENPNLSNTQRGRLMSNIGSSYITSKQNDSAIVYLALADTLYPNIEETTPLRNIVNFNFANIYFNLNNYLKAATYFSKQVDFWKSRQEYADLPLIYNNWAACEVEIGNLDKATRLIDSALFYNSSDRYQKMVSRYRLSEVYLKSDKINSAKNIINSIVPLLQELEPNDHYSLNIINTKLFIDHKLLDYDSTQYFVDFARNRNGDIFSALDSVIYKGYEIKDIIFKKLSDPQRKEAFDYFTFRDKYDNKRQNIIIHEQQTKYQVERTERENQILFLQASEANARAESSELRAEKANLVKNIILAGLILFLAASIFLFCLYRYTRRQNLVIAELRDVDFHSSMNTHNRLQKQFDNAIGSREITEQFIRKCKSLLLASQSVSSLIKSVGDQSILTNEYRICDQLGVLCDSLEKFYFPAGNIRFTYKCENTIKLNRKQCEYLFLLVEELITNTWKHGGIESRENGHISLTLEKHTNSSITMKYADRGKGIPNEIDLENKNNMDLFVVKSLVDNLHGTITRGELLGSLNIHLLKK